jgi:hypothetical protein
MDEGEGSMDIMIGLVFTAVVLTVMVLIAQRFLKPVKGTLPDCCSVRGNKDMKM